MLYIVAIILLILMIRFFTYKGKAVGTIPIGKVVSFSYSQSFFITYTHIKTDKHTLLLAHKMTQIKEGDELLMKRFQFKKILSNLSRKSTEYCIDCINLLEDTHDFILNENPEKIMAFTKEKQNDIENKK